MKSRLVFGILAALTTAQIAAFYAGLPRKVLAVVLLAAAAGGVGLSVATYMHLGRERKWLWLLLLVPAALAVFFILVLFPDIVWHRTLRYQ